MNKPNRAGSVILCLVLYIPVAVSYTHLDVYKRQIFHLMGIAARTLKENGMGEEAREMTGRILGGDCHSYAEALGIISEYVEPTDMLSERAAPKHKRKEQKSHER